MEISDVFVNNELNIVLQKEVNHALYHALPLCILLSNKNNYPWFYEHFIQCYYCITDTKNQFFDYIEGGYGWSTNKDLFEIIPLGLKFSCDETHINEFIKDCINSGYYLISFLDEYYIEQSFAFNTCHFIHDTLIYGYNDNEKVYKAVAFNKNWNFTKKGIDYTSFRNAYYHARMNARGHDKIFLILYKLKELQREYPYSIKRFCGQLSDYLTSNLDSHIEFMLSLERPNVVNHKLGFSAYEEYFKHLENSIDTNKLECFYDMKQFRFINEHKVNIYNRLNYANCKFHMNSHFCDLLEQYKEIKNYSNIAWNKYLRIKFTLPSITADLFPDHTKREFEKLIVYLRKIVNDEKIIIEKLIDYLEPTGQGEHNKEDWQA